MDALPPHTAALGSRDRRIAAWLFITAMLLQFPSLFWGIPGGKTINNALRILNGDVIYRDFWTMYAPGHFYFVAGLFKVFGRHVWVQEIGSHLFIAADAVVLFIIVRRLGLRRPAAFLIGILFVGMQWGESEVTSYETAMLFLLLALDRIVCYIRGGSARMLTAAGALCGVGAWFKHDVSFHVAIGMMAGLSAIWFAVPRGRAGWVAPWEVLVRIAGGALITALPVIALVAWKAGPDAWRDLIVFPATDFRIVRTGARRPVTTR